MTIIITDQDVRRAARQPHQFAGARGRSFAGIESLPLYLDWGDLRDAADYFDLVAIRLGEPHALAAARLVDGLDARGARRLGEPLQVILGRRNVTQAKTGFGGRSGGASCD